MASSYFDLKLEEKRELLEGTVGKTRWSRALIQKDIWVVWALAALFTQPEAPPYAFKGGTSLSKIYGVIDRFSEDVDVTIDPDHEAFLEGEDPLEPNLSKTKLRRRGRRLRDHLPIYLESVLVPYLHEVVDSLPEHSRPEIAADVAKGEVRLVYPNALANRGSPGDIDEAYVRDAVVLEFGARATVEPSEERTASTYLSEIPGMSAELELPVVQVDVLKVERTFWEKATLIHAENTRTAGARIRDRYARHWYDLFCIAADPSLGARAIGDRSALSHVLRVKDIHYRVGGVDYAQCGRGGLRLTPSGEARDRLEKDYREMRTAGMFLEDPPGFSDLMAHLRDLEKEVNALYGRDPLPAL